MIKDKYVFKDMIFNAGNMSGKRIAKLHTDSDQIIMILEGGEVFGMNVEEQPYSNGVFSLSVMTDGYDIFNYIRNYQKIHGIFELFPSLKRDYDIIVNLLEKEKIEQNKKRALMEKQRQDKKMKEMQEKEKEEYTLFLELKEKYGNV